MPLISIGRRSFVAFVAKKNGEVRTSGRKKSRQNTLTERTKLNNWENLFMNSVEEEPRNVWTRIKFAMQRQNNENRLNNM